MPSTRHTAVSTAVSLVLLLAPGAFASTERAAKSGLHWERHPARVIVRMRHGIPATRVYASARLGRRVRALKAMRAASLHVMEITEEGRTVEDVLAELNASQWVAYAEPDYLVHPAWTPNDSEFEALWGLDQANDADIDAPEAWEVTEGDPGVVVGVVDTGVDYDHPDLRENMWRNPGEAENGFDDDGNGYVDDIHGIDCISGSGDPSDDDGHGTHVAGTIGAVGDNGIGVIGVSPRVQLMALRFIGPGGGFTSDAIECLNYALEMKQSYGVNLRVTNNSWGGGGFSQGLRDAIAALHDAGILFVAAAGNDASDNDAEPHYPSSYDVPNVVSVAATNRDDQLASFSNHGPDSADLAAPGVDILSTAPRNRYQVMSGTSMATPHVSGAAALIAAQRPGADAATIKAVLLDHSDPVAGLHGRVASDGRLNAARALCSPGDLALGVDPRSDFRAGLGLDTTVRVWLRDCGTPLLGGLVRVRPSNGDPELILADDGAVPDERADDGVYAATWRAGAVGPVQLDVEAIVPGATLSDTVFGAVVEATPYAMSDALPFDWVDARAGTEVKKLGDDSDAQIPIGFDFFFYGAAHKKLRISSNGYLTFGKSGEEYANLPLPSSEAPEFLIAPYWDDLLPGVDGRAFYLLEGAAPDRRLTIQWDTFALYRAWGKVTFQVTLYEFDGRIVFRYLDVSSGDEDRVRGASATVGIQDGSGEFATLYSAGEAALADGLAIEFRVDEAAVEPTMALVSGRKLRIRDVAGRPEKRRLDVDMNDAVIAPPLIATASDPSRWGATLHIRNPATLEEAVFFLPAEGWKASKRGYQFRGDEGCRRVVVRDGSVRARCSGAQIGLSLSEVRQGSLAVRLGLGSKTSFCTHFGGVVKDDYGVGFGPNASLGSFAAADSAPPASCPIP